MPDPVADPNQMPAPAAATPQQPIMLTSAEQGSILRDANRVGWTAQSYAVPETQWKQGLTGLQQVPTGNYTVIINDGKGNNQKVTLNRAPADQLGGRQPAWIVADAPEALPKPPTTPTSTVEILTDKWGGQWRIDKADPTAVPTQVLGGDVTSAAKAQAELVGIHSVLREKNANAALGKGFATNAEVQADDIARAEGTLKQDDFELKKTEYKRRYDLDVETEKRLDAASKAGIGYTEAQTRGEDVQTDLNRFRLEQLQRMDPHDLKRAELSNQVTAEELRQLIDAYPTKLQQLVDSGAYTKEQVNELKQKMRAPTVANLGEGAYYATRTPEGQIQEQMRLGYQPKTQADVMARAGQMQAAAKAKEAEVMKKVGQGNYTADDALNEFNAWYGQNIESQLGGRQAAQEEAQFQRAKDQAEMQRQAMITAQTAGTQIHDDYRLQGSKVMAPGMNAALRQATAQGNMSGIDASAFSREEADLGQQRQAAIMQAMQAISPTAAAAGNLNLGQISIPGMFERTSYMPGYQGAAQGGGMPQAPAPAPAPEVGPTAPGFTPMPGESAEASIARNAQTPTPMPPSSMIPVGSPYAPRPGESAQDALKRIAAMAAQGLPNPQTMFGQYVPGG